MTCSTRACRTFLCRAAMLLMACIPLSARGYVLRSVTHTPAKPTSRDGIRVVASFTQTCTFTEVYTVVFDSRIKTMFLVSDCSYPFVPTQGEATFGPIPAGTYSHEIWVTDGHPRSSKREVELLR